MVRKQHSYSRKGSFLAEGSNSETAMGETTVSTPFTGAENQACTHFGKYRGHSCFALYSIPGVSLDTQMRH